MPDLPQGIETPTKAMPPVPKTTSKAKEGHVFFTHYETNFYKCVYISTHIGSAVWGFTVWPGLALCPSRWDNSWGLAQVKQITGEELLDSFWLLESSSPGAFATTSIFSFFLCYYLEKVWH